MMTPTMTMCSPKGLEEVEEKKKDTGNVKPKVAEEKGGVIVEKGTEEVMEEEKGVSWVFSVASVACARNGDFFVPRDENQVKG